MNIPVKIGLGLIVAIVAYGAVKAADNSKQPTAVPAVTTPYQPNLTYQPEPLPRNGWTAPLAAQGFQAWETNLNGSNYSENFKECTFDWVLDHYTPAQVATISSAQAAQVAPSAMQACEAWS